MLLDILVEHQEEAEMLWSRRRAALQSPGLDLGGLAAIEERLDAHLGGMALGARDSQEVLDAALHGADADEAFAAAAALLTAGSHTLRDVVLRALDMPLRPARTGIVEALCYLPAAESVIDVLLTRLERASNQDPIAIEVLSFHRGLDAEALVAVVGAPSPEARGAAARGWGRIGGPVAWIECLATDDAPEVRDAALTAAARHGLPWALDRLRAVCVDQAQVSAASLGLLSCLGDRSDLDRLARWACTPSLAEAAIAGVATLGLTDGVDVLVGLACEEPSARAAGRAFARVTGCEPPELRGGGSEEDSFEDLRPVPDARAMRDLWRERSSGFDPGRRWRKGQPLDAERWKDRPHVGDLLTRREELTRLWMQQPDRFEELELDAPVTRQRAIAA